MSLLAEFGPDAVVNRGRLPDVLDELRVLQQFGRDMQGFIVFIAFREERLRRQDSWNQIKAKTRVKSDGVSRLLTEIFSQSPEDLAQLMSDSRLTHAIRTLTGLQRQVLFLEFVERYTTGEIAAMLGSSPRNIRAQRQTALTRLRKALEEDPDPRYKKEET